MAVEATADAVCAEECSNDLFERLSFLGDALLPLLEPAAVLAVSCTCTAWRRAVQLSLVSLAPKSEIAMPFVSGCLHLRRLQLGHMQPAAHAGSAPHSLLSHLSHLTSLAHLDLAHSLTAAWRGQAVEVTPGDLAHLTHCTALQLLSLSHQSCLQCHPSPLAPLASLPALTALLLSIADTPWTPDLTAWQAVAALTGLQLLDLPGWSRCRVRVRQGVRGGTGSGLAAAAAAEGGGCCVCGAEKQQDEQQQQQQRCHRHSRSSSGGGSSDGGSSSSSGSGSSSSGSRGRIGRALARLLPGRQTPQHGTAAAAAAACRCNTAATAATAAAAASSGSLASLADASPAPAPAPAPAATAPAAAAAAAVGDGVAGGPVGGVCSADVPAPLELLSSLVRLQHLLLADWAEPPSAAGMCALQALPHLSSLDISRCLSQQPLTPDAAILGIHPNTTTSSSSSSSRQPVSLLELLQGSTKQQQQQQQQQQQPGAYGGGSGSSRGAMLPTPLMPGAPAAAADGGTFMAAATSDGALPAAAAAAAAAAGPPLPTAAAAAAGFFSSLRHLHCSGVSLAFEGSTLWGALSHLQQLDVSACSRFKGEGLAQLTALQQLVASDCVQLDYDAIRELLSSATTLQLLDLQRSTVILHGSGATAAQLSSGHYRSPAAQPAARSIRQQQQQQHFPRSQVAGSSRVDVAGFHEAAETLRSSGGGAALQAAAAGAPAAAAAGRRGVQQRRGLQQLLMNECQLAFEAFVWEVGEATPLALRNPSLLLYDLISSAAGGLQSLQVLQWSRADSTLAAVILSQLVPQAANSLTELRLSSSNLPEDPSSCWQGLAAATNLRVLDLNHTGFIRRGYAQPCGTNPTVAMLAAVAGMRGLQVLWCAGWRFYFATFKPLAGLGEGLVSLDLTRGRDVTDTTLWSLTHLTSLTWLSVAGAKVSNDQLFSLVLLHLPNLQHLDLSGILSFTPRSLPALLLLPALTSLDIRSTLATADAAAVNTLVKLPNCRRLALSVAGDESYSSRQAQQRLRQAQHDDEVTGSRGGTPRSSMDEGAREGGTAAAAAAVGLTAGHTYQQQQQQRPGSSSSSMDEGVGGAAGGLGAYAYLGRLGRAQSLRQLLLGGSTPSLTEYVRGLLPPWVDVR